MLKLCVHSNAMLSQKEMKYLLVLDHKWCGSMIFASRRRKSATGQKGERVTGERMSRPQELTVLGAVYIIIGVLNLMLAVALFTRMSAEAGLFDNSPAAMDTMTADVRIVIACGSLMAGFLTFIGGVGLLKQKSWAWGLVWVLACMGLLSFPIGTAVGAYALWVLTRSEVREALGVYANSSSVMRAIKITAALSLLLMIASYPACQLSEPIVQAELSKLSPEQRELHQFDMVYLRWALPGVFALLWGSMLAVVAIVSWIVERRWIRKRAVLAVGNSNGELGHPLS